MKIEFDAAKDSENVRKHGVSLSRAEDLIIVAIIESDSAAYGEARYRAYGYIDDVAYCLVFTMRGDTTRTISLRRAHDKEMNRYGS
jgi:uncharacterized DUF497 family protein